MVHHSYRVLALTLALGALVASCAVPALPASVPVPPTATPVLPTPAPVPPTATPVPPTPAPVSPTAAPVPPTPAPVPPTATAVPRATETPSADASTAPQQVSLEDFLPPGRGRDLLLMNCGGCHSIVCPLRGQRTAANWARIAQSHAIEKVPSLAEEDHQALFAYLAENFNDTKPEPEIPPQLAGGGCSWGTE